MTKICKCRHRIAEMKVYQDDKLKGIHYAHLKDGNIDYPLACCLEYVGKKGKYVNGMGAGYCGCTKPAPQE